MSQAFVRDGDNQFLEDIAPSLNALMAFLSRETMDCVYLRKETTPMAKGSRSMK